MNNATENLANATANTINVATQSLQTIISKAMSGVDSAVSFLSAELPDVIHQLLMWKMAESIAKCLWGISVFIAFLLIERYFIKKDNEQKAAKSYNDAWEFLSILFGIIGGILSAGNLVYCLNTVWLQILIAPKIYLLEYAASLVK